MKCKLQLPLAPRPQLRVAARVQVAAVTSRRAACRGFSGLRWGCWGWEAARPAAANVCLEPERKARGSPPGAVPGRPGEQLLQSVHLRAGAPPLLVPLTCPVQSGKPTRGQKRKEDAADGMTATMLGPRPG